MTQQMFSRIGKTFGGGDSHVKGIGDTRNEIEAGTD